MMKLTRGEAAQFLAEHDHYVILSHRRPDGDTVGSSAALCLGLRQLGKTAHVLRNREVTQRFAWLHQGLTVEEPGEEDILVCVDVASPAMLPKAFAHLLPRIRLRLDHHDAAQSFTPLELVDGSSASCAELVWDVLSCMGATMDQAIAEAVYVGLSTDTGCFRYANTTAHTFLTAARCAQTPARLYDLTQELFESNSLGCLKMRGWIVDNLRMLREGEMAVCAIPRQVELEIGVDEDDMDNISAFPRSVAGVCVASTLRETEDGEIKLSVRAVPGYDATAIAVKFGGGGHKGAAGAVIRRPLEEAARLVEAAMLELPARSCL